MPESYNPNDLAIPEMKLVQNVGGDEAKQAGAKPGDFYCAITQEIIPGTEGFEIVVTGPARKTRTYWGTTEIGDDPPICASQDGVTSVNGDNCETACPYKAYNDAPYLLPAAERRLKCTPNYNIIAIKLSDMMPVLIRCTGISSMAARELNTLLKFHKAIRGQYFKAKLRVTAIKKKTAVGEAFAIKFGDPAPITDPAILTEVKDQLNVFTGIQIPVVEIPETATPESVDDQSFDEQLPEKIATDGSIAVPKPQKVEPKVIEVAKLDF
jgi:hypothetical protein